MSSSFHGSARRVRSLAWASVVALGTIAPATALASNGTHPRTPVVWDGGGGDCDLPVLETPCMTLLDRSQDATMHLPYGIPYEDTMVTPDEVTNSRTHQFFAFCRPHDPQDFLPVWISETDVADAVAKGLIAEGTVVPEDILDDSTEWQDCFFRINADDARRPITCDMAAAGVDWDTSALPAGAYSVEGYTYEPVFNVWFLRPGVVKVHDGDPDAVGPAAAITTGEQTPYKDDVITIEGCVDALPGTTYTISYAIVTEDYQWVEYEADHAVDGDTFSFDFAPPAELAGESGMIKVDFKDPMNRTYTSFMSENIIVINADNPNGCMDDGGSFIGGPCADSSGSGDSGGSGGGTATDGGSALTGNDTSGATDPTTVGVNDEGGDNPKTCACSSRTDPSAPLVLLVGIALVRRRRRAA